MNCVKNQINNGPFYGFAERSQNINTAESPGRWAQASNYLKN